MYVTYPYAWTVNFKLCIDAQTKTYQPPIPKASQASAWSHMYIGHLMCKTEGSPIGLAKNFKGWMAEKTLGKSCRFRTSGSIFSSRSTRSRFGSASNSLWMEIHWFSIGFIEILKLWTNHKFGNALNSLGFSTNMSWAFLSAFQNLLFSLGFIKMLNSWTKHKFSNAKKHMVLLKFYIHLFLRWNPWPQENNEIH